MPPIIAWLRQGFGKEIYAAVKIGDKMVRLRYSAGIPRLYRIKFRSDIFADLQKAIKNTENPQLEDLTVFENIAYIMAKHADSSVPNDPDEWLEQFNTFSIYEILPQLIELWGLNTATQIESKKNITRLTEK